MVCPTNLGEVGFHGRTGPHILPDHSEILFGGFNNGPSTLMHRYDYPSLTFIETFALSAPAQAMCIANDGTMYWMSDGKFYRRTNPTSGGSDSFLYDLVSTNWAMAWSPDLGKVLMVRHAEDFEPQVWEFDPSTDTFTLLRIASFAWSGASPPNVVATPGSLWVGRGATLYRYDTASTLFDATVVTVATSRVAATPDGLCVFQSTYDLVGEFSIVDDSMSPTVLDCPSFTAGDWLELNYGTMDPTGAAFAVTSRYTDSLTSGDEVWVWEPSGMYTVGRIRFPRG